MVMLPGRQKPIWPRAVSIAALAWSALWSSDAGIVVPLPGLPIRAARACGSPACLPRCCSSSVYALELGAKGVPVADPAAAQGGGRAGSPRCQAVTATALRGLSRFAGARGVPAGWEFLPGYDVIEAFCVAGLAGRASSTRGTYRSALYRLAEARHGPPGQRPTPFPGARAPAPYSPGERAELAALAAAQRDPAKRSSALALVVSGIGAGLRPGELVALRGGDVARHGRQVSVHVSGPAARVVPVTAAYAGRAWQLACHAGSGFVFRPGPARPRLQELCQQLHPGPRR